MPGDLDFADVRGLSGADFEKDVDLLVGDVGSGVGGDAGTIIPVLLQQLADVLQGTVKLVVRKKFSELELGGVDDLVRVGTAGRAFNVDGPDKKIGRRAEGKPHAREQRNDFSLDIGEASCGEELADAVANGVAVEGLAFFLWQQFQQAARVAHAGQFDRFHGAAGILRHCGQGGGLLLLLRR